MRWVLHKPTSLSLVLVTGFFPFILSNLIKAGIAAWLESSGLQLANRNKGE